MTRRARLYRSSPIQYGRTGCMRLDGGLPGPIP